MGRAVGLRGEVETYVLSDAPERFAPGSRLLCGQDLTPVTVRTHRRQKDRTIVSFEEVGDREGAEALRGLELFVEASQARALEEGEYWDHDLVGCEVVTVQGEAVGTVADVLHQPSSEVLVVQQGDREVLVPLVRDVIREVVPRERITIDPPAGLLDEDA